MSHESWRTMTNLYKTLERPRNFGDFGFFVDIGFFVDMITGRNLAKYLEIV
jgi:hypothetical protein